MNTTERGEVMNPPESAAEGSEAGNLNTPHTVIGHGVRPLRADAAQATHVRATPNRPTVDEKSFELAEHFLSDLEGDEANEDLKWQLAAVIQNAIEDWFNNGHECEWLESVEGDNVVGKHCRICGADKDYSNE